MAGTMESPLRRVKPAKWGFISNSSMPNSRIEVNYIIMTILCYVFSIQMRMEVIQMGMKVIQMGMKVNQKDIHTLGAL